jgi:hypothetical protein
VYEGATNVASALTGPGGAFSFTLLQSAFTDASAYTVVVPLTATGAFNPTLYASYTSATTSPAQQAVTLAGNVSGVDFGFNPNRQQIINDLSVGPFQTEARPLRTWLGFLRDARRNRACNAGDPDVVCRADLLAYLRAILDDPTTTTDAFYLLSNPFVGVSETNENALLDWGIARLGGNPRTDAERVAQKLLAMQLNRERGWGTSDPDYEFALQSYLEAWVNNGGSPIALRSTGDAARVAGGGGGGTVEELMADAYLKTGGGGGGTVDD